MLYVLDEPSIGLHPADIDRLVRCVEKLRDRGNTVCVVEHEESMIRAADQIIEIGPGAGERGGRSGVSRHARARWKIAPKASRAIFSPAGVASARPATAAAPIMAGSAWPAPAATI